MTSFPDPLTLPRPVIPAAEREQAARDRSQRILDMLPSREPTITERLAAEKRAEAERPDLFEQTLLGFETQTSIAFLARQVGRMGYDEDPDWDPFEDHTWAALTDGLPPDMWRDFAGSNSLAHAMKIREQNLALARKRELLASAG